jgi:hypothetical protein
MLFDLQNELTFSEFSESCAYARAAASSSSRASRVVSMALECWTDGIRLLTAESSGKNCMHYLWQVASGRAEGSLFACRTFTAPNATAPPACLPAPIPCPHRQRARDAARAFCILFGARRIAAALSAAAHHSRTFCCVIRPRSQGLRKSNADSRACLRQTKFCAAASKRLIGAR